MSYQSHDRGGDTYRPRYGRDDGPPMPPPNMYHFRGAAGKRDRRNGDDRNQFNFRPRATTSDRPLLRTRHGSNEEDTIVGLERNGKKFRDLEELTDSEEAEMDEGSDDDSEGRPVTKKMRFEHKTNGDEKPRWSNPDPYTALPAPNETTGKKVDVVKLIRKARNSEIDAADLVANDEDFISFADLDNSDSAPKLLNGLASLPPPVSDAASRKRKRGENASARLMGAPGKRFYSDGMVLNEWMATASINPTPWVHSHKKTVAGLALHKEIIDYYEWIKPRDYESEVRAGVIQRLSKALNRIEPGELKAFGSFAAELYLPTGDMDLVYLPRGFNQRRGFREGISPNQFRKYGDFVRNQKLAQPGSVQLIPRAKVPIIKFIERISGLKVDLSFNNDTGVIANETFKKWKEQYPAMPVLTSVVKQFLMIRGLNDVSHMPMSVPPSNLGQILMEFFNVYGNLFNREKIAIRLDPPGYIDKQSYMPHLFNKDKKGRLTIVDPNRPDNNISGGSSEIERVFRCFSQAHDMLQNRMADYDQFDSSSEHVFSFLEDIIGGNFEAYKAQRDILSQLHTGQAGPAPAVIPPPPPPPPQPISRSPPPPPTPPPPPFSGALQNSKRHKTSQTRSSTDEGGPMSEPNNKKKETKAERRANRLRNLRADLASVIGARISVQEAVKIGGYDDHEDMERDLTRRELARSSI